MVRFYVLLACMIADICLSIAKADMLVGKPTTQPIGHYNFCKQHRDDCTAQMVAEPVKLTDEAFLRIVEVNNFVNISIMAVLDKDLYGQDEIWTYPVGAGDCEDFVLEKRKLLNEAGIALSNLLITVVEQSNGEGHAVLTVVTDHGEFILDNLSEDVSRWELVEYKFIKRQDRSHAGRWVAIEGGMSIAGKNDEYRG